MLVRVIAASLGFLLFCALPVRAELIPASSGSVILTVTGQIENTNAPDAAAFDLDMLRAIGSEEVVTSTIWTSGTVTFTGVPLVALLDHVNAQGGTIEAFAVNGYSVLIPTTDAVEGGPIIAFLRDGKEMSLRDKGPLWIVYPYDDDAKYQTEVFYSRSIWQLDRISVTD